MYIVNHSNSSCNEDLCITFFRAGATRLQFNGEAIKRNEVAFNNRPTIVLQLRG